MLDGSLIFLLSADLLQEYRTVLLRPKLQDLHGLDDQQIDQLLTELTANAIWHEVVAEPVDQAPDPGDQHLWKLLSTEPAAILVTGDRQLYESPPQQRSVMSPASCAQMFLQR